MTLRDLDRVDVDARLQLLTLHVTALQHKQHLHNLFLELQTADEKSTPTGGFNKASSSSVYRSQENDTITRNNSGHTCVALAGVTANDVRIIVTAETEPYCLYLSSVPLPILIDRTRLRSAVN